MSSAKKIGILGLAVMTALGALAKENIGTPKTGPRSNYKTLVGTCAPASSQVDLNVNNVRARLLNGGDKWWDLTVGRYEVPKIDPSTHAPSVSSLFAGALWMGGIDAAGQLKVAAMTYRQNGNDFFPGPLSGTSPVNCGLFDRHWIVTSGEIDSARNYHIYSANILGWPAKGNQNVIGANSIPIPLSDMQYDLAPFYDANSDGVYNPADGDYPVINPDCGTTYADMMIYCVYNDEGNIHTETGGQAIGAQVGELSFAFTSSDEVNNMTFYRYHIQNNANVPIGHFYMGAWVDPDLGCNTNDYVGCDTINGIGYCYNGTANDPDCGENGYGTSIPIVGVDYFEGPKITVYHDSLENGVSVPIPHDSTLGMSTFCYYNNDFSTQGNPTAAVNYYNYMKGFWKDGSPFTKDKCIGKGGSVPTTFMFPGDPGSSLAFPLTWSECSCGNAVGDRRFIQASGPFTLDPGQISYITTGVVWIQQASGAQSTCKANINLLQIADQKAQALFDNCFKVIQGPDAPDLVIRELRGEIIITLTNGPSSNNYREAYAEADPVIKAIYKGDTTAHKPAVDTAYRFQGYALYQLKTATVSASNLTDPTQAKLIAEVDIQDTVIHMYNYTLDPIAGLLPTTLPPTNPPLVSTLSNTGITHTFDITTDNFATGTNALVDYHPYYYTAVAFAHNYYHDVVTGQHQIKPYLQGAKNFKVYSAIPHNPGVDQNGMVLNAKYGDSIPVTRIEGAGNGGHEVDLDSASVQNILNSPTNFYGPITYVGGRAPLNVKVTDPYVLKNRNFVLTFLVDTVNKSASNYIDSLTVRDSIIFNYLSPSPLIVYIRDTVGKQKFVSTKTSYRIDVYDTLGHLDTSYFHPGLVSDHDISVQTEQIVALPGASELDSTSYGISVTLSQVPNVGDTNASSLGFIDATMTFKDSTKKWLTGVQDQGTYDFRNWIRAGLNRQSDKTTVQYADGFFDDAYSRQPPNNQDEAVIFYDPTAQFGSIVGATWAPYALVSNWINGLLDTSILQPTWPIPYSYGPGFTINYNYKTGANHINYDPGGLQQHYSIPDNTLRLLQSVDLVLTPDQSKWSKCVVVEMNEDSTITDGHALKGYYRKALSKDQNGNVIPTDSGRSYFPGYAINVETGERLNIMFGEDTWLKNENGGDMLWNPTEGVLSPLGQVLFGGRHCIYIMDTRYDGGDSILHTMQAALTHVSFKDSTGAYKVMFGTKSNSNNGIEYFNRITPTVYDHIMWVSMPVLTPGFKLLDITSGLIPTETKVRLRVRKPFMPYVVDGSNAGFPKYTFSTRAIQPDTAVHTLAVSSLDSIRAVPNPYYAYSGYETSQLDNEIKIINLPANSTVSIYSIDGTLIRRFQRTVSTVTTEGAATDKTNALQDNSLNWNLKNTANIPISSGVYLIYVDAPGIGEKVIKWFGVLRPVDLNTF